MSVSQSIADFLAILVDKHHGKLRENVPNLLRLAPAWEELHAHSQTSTSPWSKLLTLWWGEIEQHLDKEEAFIFPSCIEGRGPHMGAQLQTLEQEHKDHRQMMEALSQSLENGVELLTQCLRQPAEEVPFLEGAIAFHQEATQILEQLQEHIDLENRVLFPLVLGLDSPAHWEVDQSPNSPN